MKHRCYRVGSIGLAIGSFTFSGIAAADTEIRWWHAMGGQLAESVGALARQFNESQDDYFVQPIYKGTYTDTITAAMAAVRAGEPPHVVQALDIQTAGLLASRDAVYPVHQLMTDFGAEWDREAYIPAVASYYETAEGDLLALPFNVSTPVLWYDRDAFESAGLDPDEPPATWDEVEAHSRAILDSGHGCGFSFGWQSWVMLENYAAWHDIPFAIPANGYTGSDTELAFDDPNVTGLIQRIADWQEEGVFRYAGRRGESLTTFVGRECAMWLNSSAYYRVIERDADFAFGQAMLPLNTDVAESPRNSIAGGGALWVLQGHDAEEYGGVAAFLDFLSKPDVQAEWHRETGYAPITTAAFELARERGFFDDRPGTDTAIRQLSLNDPTENSRGIRLGNFGRIRDVINEELEEIWAGNKSAEEALGNAAARGNALLRRFQRDSE